MNNSEIADIDNFAPTSRIITFRERYKLSEIKSIINATRGVIIYLPVVPAMVATISGYNLTFNASIVTTGWAVDDEIIANVAVRAPKGNEVRIEESYEANLQKIGKPAFFHYLNYPINETAQSLLHRPNAQKILIPQYFHFVCNKDFEVYIRYSESSSNNVADADAYSNTNNAFSNENLIDIVQRKAGIPYQLQMNGEVRIQGNSGISTETGFIKIQIKTLSGQGNGLVCGIVRGTEITQQLF